jgi:hypothetical protein
LIILANNNSTGAQYVNQKKKIGRQNIKSWHLAQQNGFRLAFVHTEAGKGHSKS